MKTYEIKFSRLFFLLFLLASGICLQMLLSRLKYNIQNTKYKLDISIAQFNRELSLALPLSHISESSSNTLVKTY